MTWDTIDPSQYAAAGTFQVNGTIAGTTIKAVATVQVKKVEQPGNGGGDGEGTVTNPNPPDKVTEKPEEKPTEKPIPEPKPDAQQQVIELAFKPTTEQLKVPGYVSVVKVNKDGTKTPIVFSSYDPKTGIVKVKGSTEDVYEVLYTPKKFKDLAKHAWAEEAIESLAAQGVLHGVSQDQFAPQQGLKRADLVMMLVANK